MGYAKINHMILLKNYRKHIIYYTHQSCLTSFMQLLELLQHVLPPYGHKFVCLIFLC